MLRSSSALWRLTRNHSAETDLDLRSVTAPSPLRHEAFCHELHDPVTRVTPALSRPSLPIMLVTAAVTEATEATVARLSSNS